MVDTYGRWTEEKDYSQYPKEKMCDCDHMAVWIRGQGYEIKTDMENLIFNIFLHFQCNSELEYGTEFTIENCKQFVEDSGGLREFDYYA